MGTKSIILSKYINVLLGVLVLLGLYLTSLYSYLLFHSIAEIFSIVVACGIFMVAINSRRFMDNSYFIFIGIAYLFVGGLDLIHTLGYAGMGVFQGYDANLPTQLWIVTRYIEALSLLIAPLLINRNLKYNYVFLGYTVVIFFLLVAIFGRLFPDCFIEGEGLTLFKKISECIISAILLVSIFSLFQKRREFETGVLRLLVASIIVTIGSELAFIFYVSVYGFSNLIGHFFKIISFYLIYKAIIETGFAKPYNLLFRGLKQREETLRESEERYRQLAMENARLLEQAQQDAGTKATLLQEINHRVKNNLSAIIGLLYTEQRYARVEDQSAYRDILKDLISRVQGMAIVHNMLSAAEWEPLSLDKLTRQVIQASLNILPRDKRVSVDVASSPIQVTPKQANSLALLINELTTNTVNHTLSERQTAHINVSIAHEDDAVLFEFRDDGPGYPEEVLQLESHNVGLYLIQTIVRQDLRGELSLCNDRGAVTTIRFLKDRKRDSRIHPHSVTKS